MFFHSRFPSLALAGALGVVATSPVRADDNTTTVKFSDPAKPGIVKVILGRGDLRVQGADTADVTVRSEARAQSRTTRKDGLRVISSAASFALSEKDNVVTLDATGDFAKGGAEFRLTVPKSTSLVVQSAWGGDIRCAQLDGDIEVKSTNGEIKLEDVGGAALVETMNGEITASLRELREGKPLSFTTMNGAVVIRVPGDAKANVRFRTQNGSVLTDFEETTLQTKTESAPRLAPTRRSMSFSFSGKDVIPPEAQAAIREAARVSKQAVHEATAAVQAGLEAARVEIEAHKAHSEADRARVEAERAKLEAARARVAASRARVERETRGENDPVAPAPPAPPAMAGKPAPAVAPKPPVPAVPVVPTITGGKLVTGTLNGGGPEISVSTMNGDITFRQVAKK
jgi:hypothetical protein